ncbi:MAG: FIST C-terminal domain-containing protein [Spirochaetaceae bacterium]|jgi:hypothetical protein|nr:FIST C-terminal domain-containing protein [Spirochaetaceae bacterium]
MIRVFTAHTGEIDNVEKALADILRQIEPRRLLAYSLGILYYHPDFSGTGIMERLYQALGFSVVGGTTSITTVPGSTDFICLTITVITSDDCMFTALASEPLREDPFQPLEKMCRTILAEKPGGMAKPGLFYIITPYLQKITGDDYVAALDVVSGGVPIFGLTAFTDDVECKNVRTCFNGVEYEDAFILAAFWGNINPRFFLSTIPEERMLSYRAVITDSYKNRVRRINGIPALEYLETSGLSKDGKLLGIASFPIVLYPGNGSRLIRTIYKADAGELLCSGAMPVHASLGISFCDRDFVMASAKKTAQECVGSLGAGPEAPGSIALVSSCAARSWTLGTDFFSEIRELTAEFKDTLPYHFVYSIGEFCPIRDKNKELSNCFLNYSLCICVL